MTADPPPNCRVQTMSPEALYLRTNPSACPPLVAPSMVPGVAPQAMMLLSDGEIAPENAKSSPEVPDIDKNQNYQQPMRPQGWLMSILVCCTVLHKSVNGGVAALMPTVVILRRTERPGARNSAKRQKVSSLWGYSTLYRPMARRVSLPNIFTPPPRQVHSISKVRDLSGCAVC